MIIQMRYDLDRIIDTDHTEDVERIGVGNGGAVDRIGFSWGVGRGRGRGSTVLQNL